MRASEMYVRSGTPSVWIRYKGVWDMEDLYLSTIDYLREKKYKFQERIYKHKHPSPFGVERQYTWQATRYEDEYMEYVIDIYIHTYDANDIEETMADNSKHVFTRGRLWMEFKGHIVYDYEKNWESSAFYAELRNFYHKFIIRKKMEQMWWDMLWYREIHPLHNQVKNRLKMEAEGYEHRYWTGVHA